MPTPEIDTLIKDGKNVEEARRVYAKSWADIKIQLPKDFSPHNIGFVRDYFRVQLRIARGQKVRAKELMSGLVKRTGFEEFESSNESILAAIDIAVRGSTNRDGVKPAFKLG
jgi:hypothetical protein